jgi:hypothetical protein
MERIGPPDTAANRQLMSQHFQGVLNDATNIVGTGRHGTTIRESLLMGPNGGVKKRGQVQLLTSWGGTTSFCGCPKPHESRPLEWFFMSSIGALTAIRQRIGGLAPQRHSRSTLPYTEHQTLYLSE